MKLTRQENKAAFTLLELLLVFGIMVLVAGLVVGLSAVASEKKKISRTQVERERLVTLIEMYKDKVGVYPPDNRQSPFNPSANSLFYELVGAIRLPGGVYSNAFGIVQGTDLNNAFGINGMINASDDPPEVKRILKQITPDQRAQVFGNTVSLVLPFDGVQGRPNPWNYATGSNAIHNPGAFDLWADIVIGDKTNRIGNWKD